MPRNVEQPAERRRQARTPVNINALLIGEKTVPRGCRVINVSQHGMLLYCEADGRLSTFNDGDTVDIHLTVQHDGVQKKLTIPSYVRHVAENSVDVEFHHPDPILMELIESYRVSDEHKLEAALGHNHSAPESVSRIGKTTAVNAAQTRQVSQSSRNTGFRTFYLSLLGLLFTLCVTAGGYLYTASIDHRISMLETLTQNQTNELKDLKNRMFSTTLQEGRYASLNARISALGDAFAHLEDKLTLLLPSAVTPEPGTQTAAARTGLPASVETQPTELPVIAASGHPEPGVAEAAIEKPAQPAQATQPGNAVASTQSVPAIKQESPAAKQPPVASPEPAVTKHESTDATGSMPPTKASASTPPWTINLLSSSRQSDITRLAETARKAHIDTSVEQAEVKGRTYWRLQIGGFSSMTEAKQRAEPVKKALNISEVWIFKK
jgi:PilZ domain/SPOR domain